MPKQFLFVMDPLAGIDPDKDTTFVLMLETLRRGDQVHTVLVGDLYLRAGQPFADARPTIVARQVPHFSTESPREVPLSDYAAIFMRKDPPVDAAYLFATHILSFADPAKTLVLNSPAALRDANEKLFALRFEDLIPDTLVTSNVHRLRAFLHHLGGQMIVKPLDGCGGAGVFLIQHEDRNTGSILEMSTQNGTRLIMAQRYIPEVRNGDKRIILLDGTPLGAVLRVPAIDEHRGNIHVGGNCVKAALTPRDLTICTRLRPALQAAGLTFVGIDVIGDYLTEVNVTSPTGLQEINALNDVHLERSVVEWVAAHLPH